MNPALFYKGKDKAILPADLLATYLTYHANKAEDMKLLFKIRLLEKEEKISLREIKWRKQQLEAELKQQAEYYFGCHRVFSDQSLVSTSDSFKKNIYLGPYPTKALIPNGRLRELRDKLRSMPAENEKSKALKLLHAKRKHVYRYTSPSPESVHDLSADNRGVVEPIETLVGQESKTNTLEQPPDFEPIKLPDQKPEIISETHDSLHEIQKLKFKRIQSAPMPKHSREKTGGLDLDGRQRAKHKSKIKVIRAKTCVARGERLTTGFKFQKLPNHLEEKTTSEKQTREEKSQFSKGRPLSHRSKKTFGKRPRPKSCPFSASPKQLDATTQGSRARSAISSRQKQRQSDEEKCPKIMSKVSLKALDTKSSSLLGDERISRKDVLEEKTPSVPGKRTATRLDFSKAHRLVCRSFVDSETDKIDQLDGEEMVRNYLDDSSQTEEKSTVEHKQCGRRERGSRVIELEIKDPAKATEKTELKIKIPQEELPNVDSEGTKPKTEHREKRASVSEKDTKRQPIKRWTDAVGHVIDHVNKESECKRFVGHQAKKQPGKKRKLSRFKKRSFSDELKGKQSEVESDMRKKVLEYLKVYKDEEKDKNAEDEHQDIEY